jgi:hypothetical protein
MIQNQGLFIIIYFFMASLFFFCYYVIIFLKKSDLSASRDILVQKCADTENALSISVKVGFTVLSAL